MAPSPQGSCELVERQAMRPDLHVLEAENRGGRDGRGPESLGRRIRHHTFVLMSSLFASGGQSIGNSASASVLPVFRVDFL